MGTESENGLKVSAFAALALAFASFGDAFLYPFLPVNFGSVGVPLMWVWLLLSVNRFVRIISNTLLVHAFARYGIRTIMILAVALAITSTLGYGVATGLVAWLFLRILWGLAFSAMRIGTLGYALQLERKGMALGISRSLQESGPMVAIFLAPFLLQYFEPRTIFYILALLSLPSLYFVLSLPKDTYTKPSIRDTKIIRWPSTFTSITLVSAILVDGIIGVVLGVLFLHYRDSISIVSATRLAAFYLGYRRVCLVLLAPVGGWIADKIGLDRVFNTSMILVAAGLFVMLVGWIGSGAVVVFTFYSINVAVTPGSVSKTTTQSLVLVAENATWRDIGAAIGTLIGGFLISFQYLSTVLAILAFGLVVILFFYFGASRWDLKPFYVWK